MRADGRLYAKDHISLNMNNSAEEEWGWPLTMILEEPQLVKSKMDLKDNSTQIPHFRDEEDEPRWNDGIFQNTKTTI